MRRRRGELKLSQRGASERGDLSRISVVRYEKGEIPEDIRKSTLSNIDKALDWPEGHAAALLEDEAPQEVSEQRPSTVPTDQAGVYLRRFTKLAHDVENVKKALRPLIPELPPEARDALDGVAATTNELILDLADQLLSEQDS